MKVASTFGTSGNTNVGDSKLVEISPVLAARLARLTQVSQTNSRLTLRRRVV